MSIYLESLVIVHSGTFDRNQFRVLFIDLISFIDVSSILANLV